MLAPPAAVDDLKNASWGRYGGRARRGMKKSFAGGILSLWSVSSVRNRYRPEVSGLAEEVICVVEVCLRPNEWGRGWCYRGLIKFPSQPVFCDPSFMRVETTLTLAINDQNADIRRGAPPIEADKDLITL